MQIYDEMFYNNQRDGSYISAKKTLPVIFDIINPISVVDFGCGVGTWLRACADLGVKNICGLDGDHVKSDMLYIDQTCFVPTDLSKLAMSFDTKYDLAISLEVAEHLPERCAVNFVHHMTKAADVVLFGAAVPYQGGTHHINEQWQNYWCSLFAQEGYACFDIIRTILWDDIDINFWYRQNTFVYARKGTLNYYKLKDAGFEPAYEIRNIVHPEMFKNCVNNFFISQSNFKESQEQYKQLEQILISITGELKQKGIVLSLPDIDFHKQ